MQYPPSEPIYFGFQRGDFVFLAVLFVAVFGFIAVESLWMLRKIKGEGRVSHPKDLVWSLIPALVFLILTQVVRS